jgi:hypothetical protein
MLDTFPLIIFFHSSFRVRQDFVIWRHIGVAGYNFGMLYFQENIDVLGGDFDYQPHQISKQTAQIWEFKLPERTSRKRETDFVSRADQTFFFRDTVYRKGENARVHFIVPFLEIEIENVEYRGCEVERKGSRRRSIIHLSDSTKPIWRDRNELNFRTQQSSTQSPRLSRFRV